MSELAHAAHDFTLHADADEYSDSLAEIKQDTVVAVVEYGDVWCKIIRDLYEGFCKTNDLQFENDGMNEHKTSPLMISIPRDCAYALYNALKFSLKL